MALLHRVASEPVTPPVRAGALTPLVMAMLADQPEDRPSMAHAAEELQRLDLNRPLGGDPTASLAVAATQALPDGVPGTPPRPSTPKSPAVTPPEAVPVLAPRRRGLAVVFALLGLAAVALVAWQALVGGEDPGRSAAAPVTSTVPDRASPSPTSSVSPSARTEATSPSATRTTARTTPSGNTQAVTPPARVRLAQAVRDYYALLPGDTERGYALLTAHYRQTTAGSLKTYEAFWNDIKKVTVRDAIGSPPGGVEATLTYTFADGRVVEERTAYTLVDQGDTLKIDSSKVLSSREL